MLSSSDGKQYNVTNSVNTTGLSFSSPKWVGWTLAYTNDNSFWNADFSMTFDWSVNDNPDLTLIGFRHCMQVCENWCWATAVAQTEDFLNSRQPQCAQEECAIVSNYLGLGCCNSSMARARDVKDCSGPCDKGASWDAVAGVVRQRMPSIPWTTTSWMSEDDIQTALSQKVPIFVGITWKSPPSNNNKLVFFLTLE